MEKATFNVPSISCSICSGKIKDGLKDINGVNDIEVDLKMQAVNIGYDPNAVTPGQIRSKITSLGYEVIN